MNDELIKEIIDALHEYATAIDYYVYGLPTNEFRIEEMVELVKKVVNKDE